MQFLKNWNKEKNCALKNKHQPINALILFIKNPEKGKVKTRLASTVGDDRALEIYRALLAHTRTVTLEVDATRMLFYSQRITEGDEWLRRDFQKYQQADGDLGDRMEAAFQRAFEQHDRVIIIGSDCISLTSEIVSEGFLKLEQHDFVLGPALDGGYYLLGMNSFSPTLFRDMPWSTESVASLTRQRITDLGKTIYELPPLSDIDYEEDWERYGKSK